MSKDGLSEDERMAGGLMNAITDSVDPKVVKKVMDDLDPKSANDVQRAIDIGKQMRGRK